MGRYGQERRKTSLEYTWVKKGFREKIEVS
jgi:hypothetical protein